jgi:hypothetical protein
LGKRIAIILIVVLVSILALMGYFLVRGSKIEITDPYKAIPSEACILLETNDIPSFLNKLSEGKGPSAEISKIQDFEDFEKKLKFLASEFNESSVKDLVRGNAAVVAFFGAGNDYSGILFSMAVKGNIRLKKIKQIISSAGIKDLIENDKILVIPYISGKLKDTCYLSVETGLLLFSDSKKILELSVQQSAKENGVRSIPGFSKVYKAAGKNEDKIFFVYDKLKAPLRKTFTTRQKYNAERFGKIATLTGGDIFLNDKGIIITGYTETLDTGSYFYKFRSIPPHELSTYKFLPSQTGLFVTCALPVEPVSEDINHPFPALSKRLADSIREFTGDEITKAYLYLPGNSVQENTLIIYKLKDAKLARKTFLKQLSDTNNFDLFQTEDRAGIPVYSTRFQDLINAFLPGFVNATADTCFAFYDNYLISGSSFTTICEMLRDNMNKSTLSNDLACNDFMSTQPGSASLCVFCKPSKIQGILSENIDSGIVNLLERNFLSLRKVQSAGFQLSPRNDMIYTSISMRFSEEIISDVPVEWKVPLDTAAAIKPFFFVNHLTGAREIFIQDLNNNAYLVNSEGSVLWKIKLNERIFSDIYSIDYYHNRKNQLLFAGKNFLHVIDRNGNYIEKFPVKLSSAAINRAALIDYDRTGNYRILIAGEDRKLYAYDKTGKAVKGWDNFITRGTVKDKIEHFRVSGKDYIIAADESSIYILDRSGRIRLPLKEPVLKARGSSIRLIHDQKPYIVFSAPDGSVTQIFFDSSITKFMIRQFSSDHSFEIADINNDGKEEYIFCDKGKLYIYNKDRSEYLIKNFGSGSLIPVIMTISDSEKRIGLCDKEKNLVYLLDIKGEIMKGFPIGGISLFAEGKLSDNVNWNLITGGFDRFLTNYKPENANQ